MRPSGPAVEHDRHRSLLRRRPADIRRIRSPGRGSTYRRAHRPFRILGGAGSSGARCDERHRGGSGEDAVLFSRDGSLPSSFAPLFAHRGFYRGASRSGRSCRFDHSLRLGAEEREEPEPSVRRRGRGRSDRERSGEQCLHRRGADTDAHACSPGRTL